LTFIIDDKIKIFKRKSLEKHWEEQIQCSFGLFFLSNLESHLQDIAFLI